MVQHAVLAFLEATVSREGLTALHLLRFRQKQGAAHSCLFSSSSSSFPTKECAASDVDQLVAPVGGEEGRGREKNTK
jgi:hypothetical protein